MGVGEHPLGEVLEVDLVDDADAGRHDLEGVKRLHAPLQKLIALAVARELEFEVLGQGCGVAGKVHLHRMIHHEVHRHQRLDDLRVLPHPGDGRAHRRQVHQERHAGEILQDDARDDKGDLLRARAVRRPRGQGGDRRLGHALAVAVAQQRLEDQPDAHRQAGDLETGRLQRGQGVELVRRAVGGKRLEGVERIREAHGNGVKSGAAPTPAPTTGLPQLPQSSYFAKAAFTAAKSGKSFGCGASVRHI
jgi:hypothetical protein